MSFGAKLELGLRVKLKLRKGKLNKNVMLGNRNIGVSLFGRNQGVEQTGG